MFVASVLAGSCGEAVPIRHQVGKNVQTGAKADRPGTVMTMKELRMGTPLPAKLAELDTYTLRAKAQTMKLCNPQMTVAQIAEALRAPSRMVRDLLYPGQDRECLGLSQYRYPDHKDDDEAAA